MTGDAVDAALLEEILARPDEDAPRLVLADHLMQQGDPRGEFIALQCALAGDDPAPALALRCRALLAENEAAWLAPLGVRPANITWVRGFIERVSLSWSEYRPLHDVLHRWSPVRSIRVYGLSGEGALEALLALSWPERLVELSLYATSPGERGARAIAEAPSLARLSSLDLGLCSLDDAAVLEIARSETLQGLRSISLFGNKLSASSAEAIARYFPGLERLSIGQNEIGDEGITLLACSDRWRHLDLHRNSITAAGVERFVCAPMPHLRALNLRTNDISADGWASLCTSSLWESIEDLYIGDIRGDLVFSLRPSRLRRLSLGIDVLTPEGAAAFLSSVPLLYQLSLGCRSLDPQTVGQIAAIPQIRSLSLSGIPLGAVSVLAFASTGRMLRSLDLCQTSLGDEGVVALAGLSALSALRVLRLNNNTIGNRGAKALAASPHLASLDELWIGGNPMNRHGQSALRERFGDRLR